MTQEAELMEMITHRQIRMPFSLSRHMSIFELRSEMVGILRWANSLPSWGYEVIERPANMNITYGQLWQNAFPLTYIGVLSSYRFDDYLDAKLGVVNG